MDDDEIPSFQNAMLISRSNPLRARCVESWAMSQFSRHALSKQTDALEQSILLFTEAIFLPHALDSEGDPVDIVKVFYFLASAIFLRADNYRRPEDVKHCVVYLQYMRGHCPEVLNDPRFAVTRLLVRAMAIQVVMEIGDGVQDLEEMADLSYELLNSNTSIAALTPPITTFAGAIDHHFGGVLHRQSPSKKLFECLRKAQICLPDQHNVSIVLAKCLFNRFKTTPLDDDYREGMAILDKIILFRGPGDTSSPYRERALKLAGMFAETQFTRSGKPEDLEEAIFRIRNRLNGIPLQDFYIIEHLSHLERLRLRDFRITKSELAALSRNPEHSGLPSFRDLTASLTELHTVTDKPLSAGIFLKYLEPLQISAIERLTDITDIEDGIKFCQKVLASHPGSKLVPKALEALPNLLRRAFERTDQIEYINEAISACRNKLEAPITQRSYSIELINNLSIRLDYLSLKEHFATVRQREFPHMVKKVQDLDELMRLFPVAVDDEHMGILHRFPLSCDWASVAHRHGHPSASIAYDRAISLMQAYLTFSPTLHVQHARLVAARHDMEVLPLAYASLQIRTGRLQQAIETLDQGRALLWTEMRGFRSSIAQLRVANSHLADEFAAVNRDLEKLTLTDSLDTNLDDGDSGFKGIDPFGHLVERQQNLLDAREKLISQIQVLPGFDTFLKPPSFDTLRSAALHGPVIIINHSKWQSDILILLNDSPPSLITTSHDFYTRANELQDQLLEARKKGLESEHYEDALCSVLKDLYDLVGRPVIERLNELNVPEQSRVWWCPTSVFCSLPLHAMGPIPSDVGRPRYFLDLYISSYTPSLSALIESNKPTSHMPEKPSLLLVLQPDASMAQALNEMKAVQVSCPQVKTLIAASATPPAALKHLRDHQFAHIVCHGILEPGKPFDSSFILFEGKRLSLLDIVQSRLPEAEFAFLSACHTAELTDESPVDEALHLAAAMQYCGFRSVVGTMWAMLDADGPDLAGNFYKSVFADRTQGVRYYERTAEALRDAVVKLRRKRNVTLERWVNYVHYGA